MRKILNFILLSNILILQNCVLYGQKDALSLTTIEKQKRELDTKLTAVNVSNNKVTIQGQGFSKITNVKLIGSSLNADLKIDTKTDSQIIASTVSALSLLVGETFDLIIGTADAQVTYTVTFALQNGAVQLSHLSTLGATSSGQVLKFNGSSWAPAFLTSSQTYLGRWNAFTNDIGAATTIPPANTVNAGDYYIVTTQGTRDIGSGTFTYSIGDWVMSNGNSWDKITGSLIGSGTANYIPFFSSSSILANSPMTVSGSNVGIGISTPGSSLDVKGVLRLSGATSGFVGLSPAAVAGGTTYTLPVADGTNGQVLTTNATGVLSWTSVSVNGGAVTGVTSTNSDIGVASGTSAPVLTLNSGTNASQIVKLTTDAKLPAIDGSLLTNLTSANLEGVIAVANGSVGIDVPSPRGKLEVNGTAYIGASPNSVKIEPGFIRMQDTADAGRSLTFQGTRSISAAYNSSGRNYARGGRLVSIDSADNATLLDVGRVTGGQFLVNTTTGSEIAINLKNNTGTSTLYLNTKVGNLGIGTSSPLTKLHVIGVANATIATFADGVTTCTVTPATNGFACSSDQRLKKNIESYPDIDSLDKVLKLRTVTFDWKNIDNGRHTGYIAQEVEKVAPEFVNTDDDGHKQVSYSGFIPWITGAIKALYGEFKTIVVRVMTLEGKNTQNEHLLASVMAENKKLKNENEEINARLSRIEKILKK